MKELALSALLALVLSPAASIANEPPSHDAMAVMQSEGFLSGHPDINFRRKGLEAFEDGYLGDAAMYFERSALHADKASQAMLAEMHWNGIGVPQDRALGYAWMDLAAERHYPTFLSLRESYWSQLDPAEQERAIEVGTPLYAKYGDDVAKPRLEQKLRRAMRQVTGSRAGYRGALTIVLPGPGGISLKIRGDDFYSDTYWKPDHYWSWTDEVWSAPPSGRVDVGELERVQERD